MKKCDLAARERSQQNRSVASLYHFSNTSTDLLNQSVWFNKFMPCHLHPWSSKHVKKLSTCPSPHFFRPPKNPTKLLPLRMTFSGSSLQLHKGPCIQLQTSGPPRWAKLRFIIEANSSELLRPNIQLPRGDNWREKWWCWMLDEGKKMQILWGWEVFVQPWWYKLPVGCDDMRWF